MKKGMPKNFPAFLKKGLSEKLHTFFEKKVCQKTLVGCAANSGAAPGIYTGCAANSGAAATQKTAGPQSRTRCFYQTRHWETL
ncbi:hypothetical protein NSA36_06210 [Anaerotruncus colihominis]|nr:hypothetical protein [Anaerotruncus colihominis]